MKTPRPIFLSRQQKPRSVVVMERVGRMVAPGRHSKPLAALLCFCKLDGSPSQVALACGLPAAEFKDQLRAALALLKADTVFHARFHSLRTRI